MRERRLKLIVELGEEVGAYGHPIDGPDAVARTCRDLIEKDREHFHVLHLDAGNLLVGREEIAVGTLTATLITCREVFKGALLANAAAVILVHNHPSGNPVPSDKDEAMTDRLVEAGTLLGVPVLDHVVVARDGFRSIPIRSKRE